MSQAIPDIPPEAYLTKVLDHPNQVEFYVSITKESVPKPKKTTVLLEFYNRKKEKVFQETGQMMEKNANHNLYIFTINKVDIQLEKKKRNYDLFVVVEGKSSSLNLNEDFQVDHSNSFFESKDFMFLLSKSKENSAFLRAGYKHKINTVYDIPNHIHSIDFNGKEILVEGEIHHRFFKEKFPEATYFFTIKKKNGMYLKAPLIVDGDIFTAKIDTEVYPIFPKGKWELSIMVVHENDEYFYPCYVKDLREKNEIFEFHVPRYKDAVRVKVESSNGKVSAKTSLIHLVAHSVSADFGEDEVKLSLGFPLPPLMELLNGKEDELYIRLRERDSNEFINIPVELSKDNNIAFIHASVDYKQFLTGSLEWSKKWDGYLSSKVKESSFYNIRIKVNEDETVVDLEGQYKTHHIDEYYFGEFHTTIYSNLSFKFAKMPFYRDASSYHIENNDLVIQGNALFEIPNSKETFDMNILLVNRTSEESTELPIELIGTEDPDNNGFITRIPIPELGKLITEFKEIIDVFFILKGDNFYRKVKLGLKEFDYFKDDVLLSFEGTMNDDKVAEYHLTTTPKGNLKVESFIYEKDIYNEIQDFKLKETDDDIWIVGERPDTAQDNGYQFFRFVRDNYPDIKIYYAIDPKARDKERLDNLDHVLDIGSRKHIEKSLRASKLIGTHDLEYFLPFKGIKVKNYQKAHKVFLQHGVLGRKNVEYHKVFYKYPFDLFIVSSKHEKKMVEKEFGYLDDEVVVTGLARFDKLQENHHPKREILLIPTWREWITNEEKLLNSLYYEKYIGFLQSDKLQGMLEEYDLKLNFYPHYRMQEYMAENVKFRTSRIELVELGTRTVQDLLKDNSIMITDFSSVSFDFTLLGKPVIYYHFDQDVFFANGILRPIEETFLGDIVYTEDDLFIKLEEVIRQGMKERNDVALRKELIFTYIDTNNNERILKNIMEAPIKRVESQLSGE
ncbi:CDP-glycerol glycerophosphotransferase family protein [Peribacillus butanolivorans]|uniref:CDP-glycerol glycerophosphotransferase family protein n=1 Tax=Peribacillus butanolivorans TaxID=421767 RepID=UPI0006A715D6|nr:CDP-glycerol glycerophosphotransferase family protein [Peribacillus butanolivorans]